MAEQAVSVLNLQIPIKYFSLVCLVVQNSALVLLMKLSRTNVTIPYLATSAVVMGEILKLLCCVVLTLIGGDGVSGLLQKTFGQPVELLKMGFISLLYVIQNNLLFVAVSNLDAATFQVSYQLKILTTAVMSVLLLSKSLSKTQWVSLVILMLGVAFVQISPDAPDKAVDGNKLLGLFVVVLSCLSSAFAGVYFEKLLKNSTSTIWIRNIQLGLWGAGFGIATAYVNDGLAIREGGFFQGYNNLVALVIAVQAAGGLLVAVVVKYADNILKGFATSISIISSSVLSMFLFSFRPGVLWLVGASLVMSSTYLYSKPTPGGPVLPTAASNNVRMSSGVVSEARERPD
eukprot:TRINITY_DN783_c0_g1_i2.p1 TRINITY_DN783_c0_g1~~TRINITY_DN783_c0_g1_i2.p1  ORF type:complete len:345 (-),score=118.94 TRINITY_DN783_c0_g1_i2:375-1409(-)